MGYGMKIDKNGLVYYDEKDKGNEVDFHLPKNFEIKSKFFEVIDNPSVIIKQPLTDFNEDRELEMLIEFNKVHDDIKKTDLPVSYYKENNDIVGTVVPYYDKSISLYTLSKKRDSRLYQLMEVYKRDDDAIRNLFILYREIIDLMEELYNYGICYYDSNSTNYVIKDNNVHLIDFDPKHISFETKRRNLYQVLIGIDDLIDRMNNRFVLYDEFPFLPHTFDGLRKHLIKIENKVRKI